MSTPAGYTISLNGPHDVVVQQLRLLPLSRNILCLPAVLWTPPAVLEQQQQQQQQQRSKPLSRLGFSGSIPEPAPKPSMEQLKASVLKLHEDYMARYKAAKGFLEAARGLADGDRRFVFFTGGERDVAVECLKGLKSALKSEEEVTKAWKEISEGGVDGLQPKPQLSDISRSSSRASETSRFSRNRRSTLLMHASSRLKGRTPLDEDGRQVDSAYSSGAPAIPPTPPLSVDLNEKRVSYSDFSLFRRTSEPVNRGPSPAPSSVDVGGTTAVPTPRPVDHEGQELFPSLREDVTIELVPENTQDKDWLMAERILYASALEQRNKYSRSPFTHTHFRGADFFRVSCVQHDLPSPSVFGPSKINLFSDKVALEVQNEIRAVLSRSLPEAMPRLPTGFQDAWSSDFPEESREWILDPETDLFAPLMSSGFEGSGDALCPGLDLVVAIGADGREQQVATLGDESERASCQLSNTLSETFEQIARRDADSRGTRLTLRQGIRNMLPYLASYPGTKLDDVAAGHFLIPTLEACLRVNPNVRLVVVDFDLKTGCPAILALRALLPKDLLKIITVGDASVAAPPVLRVQAPPSNRIYVRNSIGNTTITFSALPPSLSVPETKPKIRRMQTAKTSLMGRADAVVGAWSDVRGGDFLAAMAMVKDGMRHRRRVCGVVVGEEREVVIPPSPVSPAMKEDGWGQSWVSMDDDINMATMKKRMALANSGGMRGSKALRWLGLE
jgi:hypothetical protein